MDDKVRTQIDSTVKSNKVVLFMKGSRTFPQCGFSATVIQILNKLGAPYETVNVLADGAVREGIKEYSQWPTIPQLYVGGEFVGGCDIVKSLYSSGELHRLLGVKAGELPPQVQSLTPQAYQAMRKAGDPHELFDVRTPEERRAASIEGSRLLDEAGQDYLMKLDRGTKLVFQCHHGIRSRQAAEYFLQQGFKNVFNLEGGIDAWSQTVDPSVPRY